MLREAKQDPCYDIMGEGGQYIREVKNHVFATNETGEII